MKIFLIFISTFVFSFSLYSKELPLNTCDFKKNKYINELRDYKNINSIDLKVNNFKKWTINNLRILSDVRENIRSEYKNRFKASLLVNYKFGTCKLEVRIRQHGDWKDHIVYKKKQNYIQQSLNIEIKNSNILGITEFILFLPHTRNNQNEIFLTNMLQEFNFLAPRSFMFDFIFNGKEMKMIFQEKINKEFLENSNKKEGPILEGDEDLIWTHGVGINDSKFKKYEQISLSRVTNSKWSARNYSNFLLSNKALSKLQNIYLNYSNLKSSKKINLVLDYFLLSNNNKKLFDNWLLFELLMISSNADHALRPHNRKFYWNIFQDGFEPIYYDGNAQINNICKNDTVDINDIRLDKYDLLTYSSLINQDHFNKLQIKLNNLLLSEEFIVNLTNKSDLSEYQIHKRIKTIIDNSQCIRKLFLLQNKKIKKDNQDISFLKNEYYKRLNFLKIDYYSIDDFTQDDKNINIKNLLKCNKQNICYLSSFNNINENSKFLSHRNLLNNKYVFYLNNNYFNNDNQIFLEKKIHEIDVKIKHTKDIKINYDNVDKKITFIQESNSARVILYDGKLNNHEIIFRGVNNKSKLNNYEREIFTGCLTFKNIIFYNIKISASGGECEDSINIIDSSGNISEINTYNSYSDGVDFDFSNLTIEKITIKNAFNDCSDFSYGSYKIKKMYLKNCGDKGISIGENSNFLNQDVKIQNSDVGISTKDSSKSFFNLINIKNTKTCLSAYKKKQEFDGGSVEIDKLNCEDYEFDLYIDDYSTAKIVNSNLTNH